MNRTPENRSSNNTFLATIKGREARRSVVGRVTAGTAAAGLALTLAGCSTESTTEQPSVKPSVTESARPTPKKTKQEKIPSPSDLPSGKQFQADYKKAADAAWSASRVDGLVKARAELKGIQNTTIKNAATHAVDTATAEEAAWESSENDDFTKAEKLLEGIVYADVRKEGEYAVDLGEAEKAAWEASDGNIAKAKSIAKLVEDKKLKKRVNTVLADASKKQQLEKSNTYSQKYEDPDQKIINEWSKLDNEALVAWSSLDSRQNVEWSDLDSRSREGTTLPTVAPKAPSKNDSDYKKAAAAAGEAGYLQNFDEADKLIGQIKDPEIRKEAREAVDAERAHDAVSKARFLQDYTDAEAMVDDIQNLTTKAQAEKAVDIQEAHDAISAARYLTRAEGDDEARLVEDAAVRKQMYNVLRDPQSPAALDSMLNLDHKALDALISFDNVSMNKRVNLSMKSGQ